MRKRGPGRGRTRGGMLPRIGETREEIQRTLVETMRGILDGRITSKEAWRIGHACNAQLKLLGLMERMGRRMETERKSKGRIVEMSKGQKGKKQWVN